MKKHNHYRAQSPLIQRGKHQPFLWSVFREKMRELCFLKLKSGIIKMKTEPRMVPCHYLAISEQWREVEEEGLAKRNRLNRVVEVFTFVQLDLESGNKADGLLN